MARHKQISPSFVSSSSSQTSSGLEHTSCIKRRQMARKSTAKVDRLTKCMKRKLSQNKDYKTDEPEECVQRVGDNGRQISGYVALREIRRYQSSGRLLIPQMTFQRLVRQICVHTIDNKMRFQTIALLALQEASEAFITALMEDSILCSIHSRRVTLMPRDMSLAHRLRKSLKMF